MKEGLLATDPMSKKSVSSRIVTITGNNDFKPIKRRQLTEIVSALLILLFMYAALSKLSEYQTFKVQIAKSPFIDRWSGPVAWALPIIEIVTVALLVLKKTRLLGLYISFFLMLLFTEYVYAMLHYSYYLPCSCGGVLSKMSWHQHLIFNISFVLISVLGILFSDSFKQSVQKT